MNTGNGRFPPPPAQTYTPSFPSHQCLAWTLIEPDFKHAAQLCT